MAIAIVLGVIVGGASIIPFHIAAKGAHRIRSSHAVEMLAPFFATIAISFIILVAGVVICKLAAPMHVVAYAVAELSAFAAGVCLFGVFLSKRQ